MSVLFSADFGEECASFECLRRGSLGSCMRQVAHFNFQNELSHQLAMSSFVFELEQPSSEPKAISANAVLFKSATKKGCFHFYSGDVPGRMSPGISEMRQRGIRWMNATP